MPDPYPGPNEEVLAAQARVCTGPHQSRPLGKKEGDPDPGCILELVLASLKGALPRAEQVSPAQMGAFFAAMSIRRTFGAQTGWSTAEVEAFDRYGDALAQMPADLRFLLGAAPDFAGHGAGEARVVAALRPVLQGGHLPYEEVCGALGAMLAGAVRPSLMAAFLIGQRMNIEDAEEIRAHLDAVLPSEQVFALQVEVLTHFGQPFDGAVRFFRPTLFVAAVRAALGRATVLHGVAEMPPKRGVTEEGILAALGARVDLSLASAARCIEDPAVGFAYVSQREYAPRVYALRHLRAHIAKRPPWATTEKVQQLFAGATWNGMIAGPPWLRTQAVGVDAGARLRRRAGDQGRGREQPLRVALGQALGLSAQGHQLCAGIPPRWGPVGDRGRRRGPKGLRLSLRAKPASCGGECAGFCGIGRGGTQGRPGACSRPHSTQRGLDRLLSGPKCECRRGVGRGAGGYG